MNFARVLVFCVALAAARPGGADRPASKPPQATPRMEQEIRELAPLLESDDLAARQATTERIVAMGEAALPVFEAEMRRRNMAPNGQVKLVLLKLRSLREDRLWKESIAKLAQAPREIAATLREGAAAEGKVRIRTEPAGDGVIALEVTIEPGGKAARTGGSAGAARPVRHVRATLLGDRTFSPQKLEFTEGTTSVGRLEIANGRLGGRLTGWSGSSPGERTVDEAAPRPLALDWALPLIAEAMPRTAGTELVFTLVDSERGATEGLLLMRCLGERPTRVDGRERNVTAFEIAGLEGSGAAGAPVRHIEIDERGRIVRAELGGGRSLEDGSPARR